MTSRFNSLADIQEKHHVWWPKPKEWRLISEPPVGEINGLPHFRGLAVATNGILVLVITSAGAALFGHLDWFICDRPEHATKLQQMKTPPKQVSLMTLKEFFV